MIVSIAVSAGLLAILSAQSISRRPVRSYSWPSLYRVFRCASRVILKRNFSVDLFIALSILTAEAIHRRQPLGENPKQRN